MKTYPINEIFYSLQGEGLYSGTPTVFIRFSGCNLRCPFCDTDHSASHPMRLAEIINAIGKYHPCRRVTLTGGEPSLFADRALLDALHSEGYTIAIETNGTNPVNHPDYDWITLSPKDKSQPAGQPAAALRCEECDELKVIFTGNTPPESYRHIRCHHRYIQPCDTGDNIRNAEIIRRAIDYCLAHPEWSLSLQVHKLLQIP